MKLSLRKTLKPGDKLEPIRQTDLREHLLKQHQMLLTTDQFIIENPIASSGDHVVLLNIQNYKLPLKVSLDVIKL